MGDNRKTYAVPNFTVRDLEIQRLKNNKSKRSDKNDMMSVRSKTSKFGTRIGKPQQSVSEQSSQLGGRSNTGKAGIAKRSSQPMQPVKQGTPLDKQRDMMNSSPPVIKTPQILPGTREGSPDFKVDSERPDSKLL